MIDWLRSFLTGRTQQVLRDGCLSEIVSILFGIPQGSGIGPILFILYVFEVFDIIALRPWISFLIPMRMIRRSIYISVPATVAEDASLRVAECVAHFDRWNRLKLNPEKTPADLARHSTAARQAHGDATPTNYVSCRV